MNKEDLRKSSIKELSLRVFNTERLYLRRHYIDFEDILKGLFRFSKAQLKFLKQDLKADLDELKQIRGIKCA